MVNEFTMSAAEIMISDSSYTSLIIAYSDVSFGSIVPFISSYVLFLITTIFCLDSSTRQAPTWWYVFSLEE